MPSDEGETRLWSLAEQEPSVGIKDPLPVAALRSLQDPLREKNPFGESQKSFRLKCMLARGRAKA